MTRLLRLLGVASALMLILGPPIGLLLGSVVEVRPSGELRPTVVRWGLTLSDPFVGACLWNSVAITVVVVASATIAGVTAAIVVRGLGPWRRSIALALIRLAAGCHPFSAAIGLLTLASLPGVADVVSRWDGDRARWLALGLAQFGFASAWIAWWAGRALDRIRPDWLLVATLSGSGRGRIWWSSIWPLIRPTVARAAASVGSVLVIEPGGPLVLGLRRTLGYQVVASCWMTSRPDWPRAATLAGAALLLAAAARLALLRWGGPDELPPADASPRAGTAHSRSPGAIIPPGRIRAAVAIGLLGSWLVVCLVPAAAVLGGAALSGDASGTPGGFAGRMGPLAPAIGPALAVGLAVAVGSMLLAWPLSAFRAGRSGSTAIEAMPPLAIGVGLLALHEVLRAIGGAAPDDSLLSRVGPAIDPYRSPWLLVTWGTALAQAPWSVEAARRSRQVDAGALQDAARLAGDRRARSRTLLLLPIGLRRCLAPTLGIALLAASGLAPALVLTPLEPFRPIGPSIVFEPGIGTGLAAIGLTLQLLGVSLLLRQDGGDEAVAVLRS